jgi:hypothetical protein
MFMKIFLYMILMFWLPKNTFKQIEKCWKFGISFNPKKFIFWCILMLTHSQVPCWTQVGSKSVKQRNCLEFEARSQLSTLKGVKGHAEFSGWDKEEGQALVTYLNLHQTNQQVG